MVEEQPTAQCPHCGYPVETQEHGTECPNNPNNRTDTDESPEDTEDAVRPKSAEELEQQYRFVAADQQMDWNKTDKLPELNPALLELTSQELQDRLADDESLKKQYDQYLEGLRTLRRESHKHYTEHSDEADESKRQHEQEPQQLFERILEKVQGGKGAFTDKYFRDDEIDAAKKSTESFYQLLRDKCDERPDFLIQKGETLAPLFSQEEFTDRISVAAEKKPFTFLNYLSNFSDKISPDRFEEMVSEAITHDTGGLGIKSVLSDEKLASRLDEKVIGEAVGQAHSDNFLDNIGEYVEKGYVTADDARAILLEQLTGGSGRTYPEKDIEKQYLALFTTEDHRKQIEVAFQERFDKGLISSYFFKGDFTMYGEALGEEWKKRTVTWFSENQPNKLIKVPEVVDQYMGEGSYATLVDTVINDTSEHLGFHDSDDLLTLDLTESQDRMLCQRIMSEQPTEALSHPDRVMKYISDEDRPQVTRDLLDQNPRSMIYRPELLKLLTDMSDEEQKEYARGLLENDDRFNILDEYSSNSKPGKFLRELIPQDGIVDFMLRKSEINSSQLFLKINKLRETLGGDDELKQFVSRFAERNVYFALSNFSSYEYLLDGEERVEYLNKLTQNEPDDALSTLKHWAPLIPHDRASVIVGKLIERAPDSALIYLKEVQEYTDPEQQQSLSEDLAVAHPFIALNELDKGRLQEFIPVADKESIESNAMEDDRIRFASRSIKNAFKGYNRAKTTEQAESAMQNGQNHSVDQPRF